VDDRGSRGPGRRPDDDRVGDERAGDGRAGEADQEYDWGGKPGEDFGPMAPPTPLPSAGGRRGGAAPDPGDETARLDPARPDPFGIDSAASRSTARRPAVTGQPLRPDGVFTRPPPRRRWGLILGLLGALAALGSLAGAVLFVALPPGLLGLGQEAPVAAPASTPVPAPAAASPAAPAKPAVTVPSPGAAASPTPLTIGAPRPSPAPARSPAASPAVRTVPAILPTPPALVTPPAGPRFPTSTPVRIGSPQAVRTPPPVPTPRLPNILTRVWSEQVVHKVGDDASICAQTSSGASAQLLVIAPDRSPHTLGEFSTPADRVCYTLRVDQPDLWVLTLIIRDADANEIDRQAAALWVSR
jgi:hypothetical protein